MKAGLAIFVKTPGLSPVKTRLAQILGTDFARQFHRLASAAVAEVAAAAQAAGRAAIQSGDDELTVYWAVAEEAGLDDPQWAALPRLWQGTGDLGTRMATIHGALLARHDAALLIGADAPQLHGGLLRNALQVLETSQRVIGPADDGGFWLFGSRHAIPLAAWQAVVYSRADTRVCFERAVGRCTAIGNLCDVDDATDLPTLKQALADLEQPLPAQRALAAWLAQHPAIALPGRQAISGATASASSTRRATQASDGMSRP